MPLDSTLTRTGLAVAAAATLAGGILLANRGTPPAVACACSSGSQCQVPGLPFNPATFQPAEAGMVEAPRGTTLQPGWVGSGCVPKACVEVAGGPSSWPSGCPVE